MRYLDALRVQRELGADELRQVGHEQRAAFAAAAAEEVLPVYGAYLERGGEGDLGAMQEGVAAVWEAAGGAAVDAASIVALRERCFAATPHADDAESALDEAASDAGLVVVAAIRAAGGDREAANDAAAGVLSLLDNLFGADDDSEGLPRLIELEIERQRAVLRLLQENGVDPAALRALGRPAEVAREVQSFDD